MTETKYTVANRIRAIRNITGLKQSAVARMLKISQQSYCCIEKSEDIHTSTLYRVSQVLGVDAALIVSPNIPITEETVKEFSLNSHNNLVVELLDLRKKVVNYKSFIRSIIIDGKTVVDDGNNMQVMMSA